nr:hypothetical protein [Streptomyces sp. TSRI0281]
MASTERETKRQAAFMCPTCKHPVTTELKRHKTLGIFVPVWGPGPCENPDCADHRANAEPTGHRAHP